MSGPYGFTQKRRSITVAHVVASFDGGVVRWRCGNRSILPVLVDEVPTDLPLCERCDFEGAQSAPSLVYAGITSGGHLKVGFTTQIAIRMKGLHIVSPIATCPGGKPEEAELVRLLSPSVTGREWFDPTPDRLERVRSFMAEHAA